MKTTKNVTLAILALASGSAAFMKAQESLTSPIDYTAITLPEYTNITISCGNGQIVINTKTGAVELPKDVPLDKAATEFWLAVAKAFPEARRQIIKGESKP